jgi:ABC-type nitrate/sulfonate/bicarbonate transport system permease component
MSAVVSPRVREWRPTGAFYSPLAGVALLLLWQGLVQFVYSGNGTIPSPAQIAQQFWADGPMFYILSASHTLRSAALGWVCGNALAVALAMVAVAAPVLARPILQLGVVSFCLPLVAIGPVLTLLFDGDIPRIALAALTVFFTTLVGALIGLRGADPVMLELVHGFGGRRVDQLVKVRLRAALPSLFAALRIASPSAILGAMIAEFLGAENGLGVILINSQQGLNYSRTWAIAAFATCVAGLAYGLTSLAARALTPWARETTTNIAASAVFAAPATRRGFSARAARIIGSALLSTALILLAWQVLLRETGVSPFIGKGPADVWIWLTDPATGAANVQALAGEALVSLRDASIGLAAGSCAAILTAIAFTLWPPLHRTFIGPSLALQSVPLIAVTPVIVLIFGRNLAAIAVIGGLVAFFPTLVNVSLALSRTPRQAVDLMHVYGASRLATLWKVQLPTALPALFASLRIAAPLAVTGAMLAEWLATGQGLGYAMLSASAQSDYDGLWARVALSTAFSLAIYKLVGFAEQAVLSHFAATQP